MVKGITWANRIFGKPQQWHHMVVCDIEWFKEVLAASLTVIAVKNGFHVDLIDENLMFRTEILEKVSKGMGIDLGGMVDLHVELSKPLPTENNVAIILNPKEPTSIIRALKGIPYVILHYRIGLVGVKGRKVYCKRVGDRVFILKYGDSEVKVEGGVNGVFDLKIELPPYLKKALECLQKALVEYGPLTIPDAVTVISGSLKVDKSYARRMLYELVRRGLVKVEGKNVLIA